jgi:hypothetical protein
MESWNHSFKVEAIHGEKFKTREEAKNHVFDYVEVYTHPNPNLGVESRSHSQYNG